MGEKRAKFHMFWDRPGTAYRRVVDAIEDLERFRTIIQARTNAALCYAAAVEKTVARTRKRHDDTVTVFSEMIQLYCKESSASVDLEGEQIEVLASVTADLLQRLTSSAQQCLDSYQRLSEVQHDLQNEVDATYKAYNTYKKVFRLADKKQNTKDKKMLQAKKSYKNALGTANALHKKYFHGALPKELEVLDSLYDDILQYMKVVMERLPILESILSKKLQRQFLVMSKIPTKFDDYKDKVRAAGQAQEPPLDEIPFPEDEQLRDKSSTLQRLKKAASKARDANYTAEAIGVHGSAIEIGPEQLKYLQDTVHSASAGQDMSESIREALTVNWTVFYKESGEYLPLRVSFCKTYEVTEGGLMFHAGVVVYVVKISEESSECQILSEKGDLAIVPIEVLDLERGSTAAGSERLLDSETSKSERIQVEKAVVANLSQPEAVDQKQDKVTSKQQPKVKKPGFKKKAKRDKSPEAEPEEEPLVSFDDTVPCPSHVPPPPPPPPPELMAPVFHDLVIPKRDRTQSMDKESVPSPSFSVSPSALADARNHLKSRKMREEEAEHQGTDESVATPAMLNQVENQPKQPDSNDEEASGKTNSSEVSKTKSRQKPVPPPKPAKLKSQTKDPMASLHKRIKERRKKMHLDSDEE